MTCGEAYRLVVQKVLTPALRSELDAHVAGCEACREAIAMLRDPTEVRDVRPEPTTTLEVGDRVGNFRIDSVLGTGGMGIVFAATHVDMGNRVAIKVLRKSFIADAEMSARFTRDAMLVAKLKSEHICRVTTLGRLPDGEPYTVLEFLDGTDLFELLERERALPPAIAVDYVIQACEGLAEAHARGIVHRDIKPANLFRVTRPDGSPLIKVLDFGIAKARLDATNLTVTGIQIGSLPYMSPEQLRSSKSVDARADVWSIGATLYHLIAGDLPFRCDASHADAAIRIWSEPPRPLPRSIPLGLSAAIERALEKDPNHRHRDIAAFALAVAPFGSAGATEAGQRVERVLHFPRTTI